jgi:hypothetical protein
VVTKLICLMRIEDTLDLDRRRLHDDKIMISSGSALLMSYQSTIMKKEGMQ